MKKLPESFGIMRDAENPFKAMKFRVENPEHSRQIQERLFEMGYKWMGSTYPKIGDMSSLFLFTNDQGFITHQNDINWFNKRPNTETTLSDISPWQPKQGETIEVRDGTDSNWRLNEFLYYEPRADKPFVTFEDNAKTVFGWKFARPHNPHREEIERLKARLKELEG